MAPVLSLAFNPLIGVLAESPSSLPTLLIACLSATVARALTLRVRSKSELAALLATTFGVCVAAALSLGLLVFPFVGRPFRVTSNSMSPNLRAGDVVWVNRLAYSFGGVKTNDVVVLVGPGEELFAKRVVGRQGDVVEVRDGVLVRNSEPVDEPFISSIPNYDFKLVNFEGVFWPVCTRGPEVNSQRLVVPEYMAADAIERDRLIRLAPASIPKGMLIVMGDSRASSADSRAWGLVAEHDVLGRVERVLLPLNRSGSLPGVVR